MKPESLARFAPRLVSLAILAAVFSPAAVLAQSQSDASQSVAEAARKAREQKKKSQKAVKSLTDDDLAQQKAAATEEQAAPQQTSIETTAPTSQTQTAAPPKSASEPAASASNAPEKARREAELKELKRKLADAQKDLDLLQRDFALQRDQFYSNAAYARDFRGKARLDALQNQIRDKQGDIERLKTRIAALEELLGRPKNSSPGASEKPAPSPQS